MQKVRGDEIRGLNPPLTTNGLRSTLTLLAAAKIPPLGIARGGVLFSPTEPLPFRRCLCYAQARRGHLLVAPFEEDSMNPMQQPLNSHSEFEVSLEGEAIRSCSLRDGKLDVTLTNNLRLEFNPTHPSVRRYLYVVENRPLGVLPSNFVERIELLLREGLLGEPKLLALSE